MHRLNELAAKLTPAMVREVEDFAEFLLSRHATKTGNPHGTAAQQRVSFEGWAGSLAHVHPEMSDAEFKQFMLDERVREAMR